MPVTEVLRFAASDALSADVNLFKGPLKTIANADGFISMFYGLQKEDNHIAYLVINWETLDHHLNFMKHSSYPSLLADFKPLHTGPLEPEHVEYDVDPTPALSAPVTELVIWKLKPDVSLDEFHTKHKVLREFIDKGKTIRGTALGEFKERKDFVSFVLGWDSIQAHHEAAAKYDKSTIDAMYALCDIELNHSELVKYTA